MDPSIHQSVDGLIADRHYAAAHPSESSVDASGGDDPQSLAVEVDSDQFVDVAVGPDRLPDPVGLEESRSNWLTSYAPHRTTERITDGESEPPRWTEISKYKLHAQPTE